MNLVRKVLISLFLATLALPVAQAQPERFREGTHYSVLAQDHGVTIDGQQVEEFFWYGCGSCYAFEPLLAQWQRDHPEVALIKSPGVWSDATASHARLFYAVERLDDRVRLHGAVFDAIHQRGNALLEREALKSFFAAEGVDWQRVEPLLTSFGIDARVRQADRRARALKIPSVPSLVVNGRYLVRVNRGVPTHAAMLDVVDHLLSWGKPE